MALGDGSITQKGLNLRVVKIIHNEYFHTLVICPETSGIEALVVNL